MKDQTNKLEEAERYSTEEDARKELEFYFLNELYEKKLI
jgi:hypothetical protein